MREFKYEERIVAFLDILGFKNAINETVKLPNEEPKFTVDKIIEIFNKIDVILSEYYEPSSITRFSDTILIIASAKFDSTIFTSIKNIHILLIEYGLLLRGGIAKGDIYFNGDGKKYFDAFGPAIIKAHELEQQAVYPRVLVDRSITGINVPYVSFEGLHPPMSVGKFYEGLSLINDFDGFHFLDYFSMIRSIRDKEKRTVTIKLLDDLIEQYKESPDINLSKKYGWLDTHWANIKRKNMQVDIGIKK